MQRKELNTKMTPMMQQYNSIKMAYDDCLLFYRMGDFYELFFDDAIKAAQILEIALTKRGKHNDEDIPMCGVPAHAYEHYLEKLIKSGMKIAICEQLETPDEAKKRGYKAVVKREVVRVVTPGTVLEEKLLPGKQNIYLSSLVAADKTLAIAWIDISIGDFYVSTINGNVMMAELARLAPNEILVPEKLYADDKFRNMLHDYKSQLSVRPNNTFDFNRAQERLCNFFKVATIESFGDFNKAETIAIGSLLEYIEYTQKSLSIRLAFPKQVKYGHYMQIDESTRRNLELTASIHGNKKNSLLGVLDHTLTNMGGRLLQQQLTTPLCDKEAINTRLDNVECLINQMQLCTDIRLWMSHFPDMERALSRIHNQRATPKDLVDIREGLTIALQLAELLNFSDVELSTQLKMHIRVLGDFGDLLDTLTRACRKEVSPNFKGGNYIKPGYDAELDNIRNLAANGTEKLEELRANYQGLTEIPTLKINYNNVIGYFIDVTPLQSKKIANDLFIHKQTLGSSVRYTTIELQRLANDILSAEERANAMELEIFHKLCSMVLEFSDELGVICQAIAVVDVSSSLAYIANKMAYTRPIIDESTAFSITEGRHPIVETIHKNGFIANSCNLNQQKLILMTGPNMAGKSTFLRQNALIAIMAQMGSFVPAKAAHIGIIDRLFSRIGAGDDISRGQSTFFVEMNETAFILNNATAKSLVILDELGRGTSTYDGLAIAWAVIESLHNQHQSRTLFATHYHELTQLEVDLPQLQCCTMKVEEWDGKIIFMHEVIAGKADRSYGIHVAELAGIPREVTKRATELLKNFND